MGAKNFLKPSILNILIFLFVGVMFLYFGGESVCGVSFFFSFCYSAYGFPFPYMATGDIGTASGYIKTLFLGDYFNKFGNFLFNPAAFLLDIALIYIMACFMAALFNARIKKS